nr:MAG TPA: hypothetical protein [Caudoviricetes sp.]
MMFLMALTAVGAYFFRRIFKYIKLKNIRFFAFKSVDNSKKESFLS